MHRSSMRLVFLMFMGWILGWAQVHAQNRTLSGYISDAATGETLIGATQFRRYLRASHPTCTVSIP